MFRKNSHMSRCFETLVTWPGCFETNTLVTWPGVSKHLSYVTWVFRNTCVSFISTLSKRLFHVSHPYWWVVINKRINRRRHQTLPKKCIYTRSLSIWNQFLAETPFMGGNYTLNMYLSINTSLSQLWSFHLKSVYSKTIPLHRRVTQYHDTTDYFGCV